MEPATETELRTVTITNTCTCMEFDPETGDDVLDEHGERVPAATCDGLCWEGVLNDVTEDTRELRDGNTTGWWRVTGLRLWNGDAGKLFHADNVRDLLQGMTVRSEWHMSYTVFTDRIEYSLSHHDAPMGSSSVLRPVTDDQRETWGLY